MVSPVVAPRTIEPLTSPPDVEVTVPGSKSHTNRALVCAALAEGTSALEGALFADDTLAMAGAVGHLGAKVTLDPGPARMAVTGCGGRLAPGPRTLSVNQSGTTGRFLLAVLGLGEGRYVLDGDPQLRARPMGPLVGALGQLGATIEGDRLPITVTASGLRSGTVHLPGSVSSQFLSGLLLAAPYAAPGADGGAVVIELSDELISRPYVDLTVATMAEFGVAVEVEDHRRYVVAHQAYRPRTVAIEPDASAASYFFAAAAITGGRVRVPGLGRATVQGDLRFVELLAEMGAGVEITDHWTEVTGTGRLDGLEVDMADISDTAQTLAVVATFASSPTRVTGIGFIAAKETDRVAAVVEQLTALGLQAEAIDDGFVVHPGTPRPAVVETYDDHRMAMSFALLGLVHPGMAVANPGCVDKTFPTFFEVLDRLRSRMEI
jgi:3-phosphoshikimate 1-carboxyvinyltransferase